AQTTWGGGRRGGLRRSVVGGCQVTVTERDASGGLVDDQCADVVRSFIVRIGQRGHNSVAAGVGGRRGRSVVSDRDHRQISRAGGRRGRLGQTVVDVGQAVERDDGGGLADDQSPARAALVVVVAQ